MVDNSDPVYGLIKLYAHQKDAIDYLQKCRVNPDFNSNLRNDLEFYVPQLCSIYMVGEIDNPERLSELILNSCQNSIFFSHRIWFFCQSLLFASTDEGSKHRDQARDLIKNLEQVVIKSQELLCLVNSFDLMQQIIKLGLLPLYPSFNRH